MFNVCQESYHFFVFVSTVHKPAFMLLLSLNDFHKQHILSRADDEHNYLRLYCQWRNGDVWHLVLVMELLYDCRKLALKM